MRYRLRTLLILLVVSSSTSFAAGPIDPYEPKTLSEKIDYFDAVVVAKFVAGVEGSPKAVNGEFEVIQVIKAKGVDLKKGSRIIAPYYAETSGKSYLICGKRSATARIQWSGSESIAKAATR